MATSEIEKLERRYAENPHGLTFAPLAEVHRKNGDLARALELLTAGLELHPNYIPASIVLGRCHQDLADLPSAEAAFAHVLRLDDENVIALKSLADITERLERFEEAETWLRRLVSVDRSNDEARAQLQRIETARQGEKESDADEAAPAPLLEMIDLTPDPLVERSKGAGSSDEQLPVDIAAMELSRPDAERPSGHEEPAPPLASAGGGGQDQEPGEPAEPVREEATTAQVVTPVETAEPPGEEEAVPPLQGLISAEFQPPLEATGGLGVETSEEVVLEVSGESEFRIPDSSEDLRSPAPTNSAPVPVSAQRPEEAAPAAAPDSKRGVGLEFVVTEAMANLEEAAQRPSYVAADTKGQSVAAFFRALVASRLQSEPGAAGTPAAPGRATGEQKADGAVSFDDFFDSAADGSAPLRHRNSDSGEDDLDQFQSWLQNLKR